MAAPVAAASRGALLRAGLTRPGRRFGGAALPDSREAVKEILNHLIAGDDAAALKVARPFASQEGKGAAEYAAHHASECAAVMFTHAEEARRLALISAGTGKALEGRDLAAVELLDPSLWLPEVQQCWSRHHDVARLSGAALRLRVTPMAAEASSGSDCGAAAPAPEARDWQVLGRVVPVRLLLSPWAAVLQSYASSAVVESRSTAGIHPAVHGAMMNQAKHWQEHIGQPGPEGPLEDPSGEYAAAEFREWATQSAEAAKEHVRLTSHFFAEVAQHTLGGGRGDHFLTAAAELVGADPALDTAAVEYATRVFKDAQQLL